jgi:1-deoxy-D-xylulose-5-phosphate reductoisomerase
MMKIAVLGSTGSIGRQTLEVLSRFGDLFEPMVLTAHANWQLLAQQARAVMPDSVVIAQTEFYEPLKNALADLPIKVWAGEGEVAAAAEAGNVDVVVNALVGWAGLEPTLRAAAAGKKIALANKESLVVAGESVMRLAAEKQAPVLPIDSEHSAILQCLVGERAPLRRVILTASGGALRDVPLGELANVTAAQALAHPNWTMGHKITIDSATLLNKGFEVVEARWLFGLAPEQIDVVLHPQSIVHSMVEFVDGSVKAQMGTPDMRTPIAYALSFPDRLPLELPRMSLTGMPALSFTPVDHTRYPVLGVVMAAMAEGGSALCTVNAAGEVAVAAFLEGRIAFTDIVRVIAGALEGVENIARPTFDDLVECNKQSRIFSANLITKIS